MEASLFQRLQRELRRVTIDDQELFVAEGDTLLDEDQLAIYAMQREAANAAIAASQIASTAGLGTLSLVEPFAHLLGMTENGKIVRWSSGTVLSYRVIRETFPSGNNYELVVRAMAEATAAWEATCGVEFRHLAELDGVPGLGKEGALFTVRELDAGGAFIAAAFFPNDPVSRRRVVIDPSYYTTAFDQVGVLRHELGHVLGCRHEHIRSGAPPACPDETIFNTLDLTQYDPRSVMHYFCGDVGSKTLEISELDRVGSQKLYGPPLRGFRFVTA
jgi:hypothetical protein